MIQTDPRCFECGTIVSSADLIFAPPCGSTSQHDTCGSAVWHPLCLMEYREHLEHLVAEHSRVRDALVRFLTGQSELPDDY